MSASQQSAPTAARSLRPAASFGAWNCCDTVGRSDGLAAVRPSRVRRCGMRVRAARAVVIVVLPVLWMCAEAAAAGGHGDSRAHAGRSLADSSWRAPTWDEFVRVVTLQDYNTRVVLVGTMLLGVGAGIIGTFMLLRKRSLVGDALSHATLPGIGIAFLVMVAHGGAGKWLPGLLLGATVSGVIGMGCVLAIRHLTRLKEDAALGIVLSVFFGVGIAIFGLIQKMSAGSAAGLESFIYGKTASMLAGDAQLIAAASALIVAASLLLFKEFSVVCFDQEYAASQGWPVIVLDAILMSLVVAVTVIGLQAVGLMLIVALLIIPAAAARFWTERLRTMTIVAALIGAASGLCGSALSALLPRAPAGAVIVLCAGAMFAVSMAFGSARGLWVRGLEQFRLRRRIGRQHLLRALYEWAETDPSGDGMWWEALLAARSWSAPRLRGIVRAAGRHGLVERDAAGRLRLTASGAREARRLVRNHRLWELYLITHAEIAPSHVDRDADQLEHVLGRGMVGKLERLLAEQYPEIEMPPSPHELARPGPGGGDTQGVR
jgi:manganese/zinc/iron transport system permease protein